MHPGRRPQAGEPIAIVGLSAIMPGAEDAAAFWRALVEGQDMLTDVPADRWHVEDHFDTDPQAPDRTYAKRGGFMPKVTFDPMALGIPPTVLPATDAAQLLALVSADRLLNGTGLLEGVERDRVGVFIGSAALQLQGTVGARAGRPQWRRALLDSGLGETAADAVCDRIAEYLVPWQLESFPGMLGNVVAGRIAKRFDLHGANFTVDAACASSLAALSVAVDDLRLGRSDLVITGGVDTMTDPATFICFSKTPALSPTGDCRPFDADADGTMLGEGVALFALKRLADAEDAGDRIHAVIRGIGAATDGSEVSVFAPSQTGQERALRRAYSSAGYEPHTVSLVEAHGTGTPAGDAVEIAALRAVFTPDAETAADVAAAVIRCALGSVKSQIGHTKAASGAAGMLKATLALGHQVLPPTIKIDRPHPELAVADSPFYLNTMARPWFHRAAHPRRASVSSFGFGGVNYHVALEEYRSAEGSRARPAARLSARTEHLVALSAATPDRLAARCRELAAALPGMGLAAAVRQAAEDFRATDQARLGLVVTSTDDLARQLTQAAERITTAPTVPFAERAGVHYGVGRPSVGRLAFLFPGQGTQYVGMGTALALHFPQAHAFWERHGTGGLTDAVFPEPGLTARDRSAQQQRLNHTEMAQPAIAGYSAALLAVLDMLGVRPDCVAGHSFGELIALYAARAVDEDTLMRIARARGTLLREATKVPGAMLAISADEAQVQQLLDGCATGLAWIAVHNAPQQVVVAGHADVIARVAADAERAGIAAALLPSDVAFHTPLLDSATAPLQDFLGELTVRAPLLDVYGNTDSGRYPVDPDAVRRQLAAQAAAPVRFQDMIETMYADGVRTFVEAGPGRTLSGLVRQILGDRPHRAIPLDRTGQRAIGHLYRGLAELAAAGLPVDLTFLDDGHTPSLAERTSPPGSTVLIDAAPYGRRYPLNARFPVSPLAAGSPMAVRSEGPASSLPAPAAEPAPTGRPSHVNGDLARALAEAQRETARAHAAYLDTAQKTMAALTAWAAAPSSTPGGPRFSVPPGPVAVDDPPAEPFIGGIRPAPRTALPAEAPGAPLTVPESRHALEALVLATISDKTGYPVELLALHMELESDLGLDSITRTRILAALRPSFPQMEALGAEHFGSLGALRTIGEIVEYLWPLIEEAVPTDPQPVVVVQVRRHTQQVVPTAPAGTPMRGLDTGPLLITPDSTGVAEEMAERLRRAGLVAAVGTELPDGAGGVVFLGGLCELAHPREALAVQREAFRLARSAAVQLGNSGGVFVTVQDTGGLSGNSRPDPLRAWLGGLAALPRTVRCEYPKASVKAVDCHRGGRSAAEVASALVEELLNGGPDVDVALGDDNNRSALRLVETPVAPTGDLSQLLGEAPLIIATGAAHGIGRACVLTLAQHHRARFLVIGRTPAEDSRIGEFLASIRQAGSEADYACLDVRDEQALDGALDRARTRWGSVTGLLHLAGVLADGRIERKTDEQFTDVFDTKAVGLHQLLTATRADPLRLLCAFSSVVSATGNHGQCDYAMANETLNQVLAAEQGRRPEAVVRSLLWGPWQGGMVTPELRDLFDLAGVETLPLDTGARAFVDELRRTTPDPRVVLAAGRAALRLQEVTHSALA
ncbi:SDR family NAD(P)-dependent oxidoreductase [Streptomyces goshikiensis]|uniref:SDR family NAD(P)-dependent oxidoreductase n=1 Tax=Streptomyces goshikiensis TaxID=1942 RepID=UPI003656A564